MTVATAIRSPCVRQRSMSGRISRMMENSSPGYSFPVWQKEQRSSCSPDWHKGITPFQSGKKNSDLAVRQTGIRELLHSGLAPRGCGTFARTWTARRPTLVDGAEQIAQINQAVQVMGRQEIVDIGQGCFHTDGQRAIVGRAEQRA